MIGRADIEGSKSDVALDAWPPQASYPYGNFSDTSNFKIRKTFRIFTCIKIVIFIKGSLGLAFTANTCTENMSQINF